MTIVKKTKEINIVIALILSLCVIFTSAVTASAAVAFAGGSGTENDPYLVATPEQFSAIRNNLSAHYKLANTIDLSSVSNFTPIGNLERPFKGSLTCDLGSDGLPLYAVKNLTVKVAKTDYVSENKSKWEAAAFGAADGAQFTNIYMLNVRVSNDNFGDNTGNVVYGNYKPGMDEMFSAALIGYAKDCTVMGCMSSGKIDTSSNNCAGLIGKIQGTTVANCYSSATVKSTGKWGVGGLIGTLFDSTLTNSCYIGAEVSCGSEYSSQGMLFATAENSIISDCYAEGKGLTGQANIGRMTNTTVSNCYSSAVIQKGIPDNYVGSIIGVSLTNVYVIDTCNIVSMHTEIPKASAKQINAAFKGLTGWNTDGKLPTLTSVKILSDESRYVPGAAMENPSSDNSSAASSGTSQTQSSGQSSTGTSQTQSSGQSAAGTSSQTQSSNNSASSGTSQTQSSNQGSAGTTSQIQSSTTTGSNVTSSVSDGQTADTSETVGLDELIQMAEKLPAADNLTADDIMSVLAAKDALDNLSDGDYAQLDSAVADKIQNCYTAIQPIMLQYLVTEIEALEVEKLTADDSEKILTLKNIYDKFDEGTKDAFSSVLLEKLNKAVEKVNNAQDTSAKKSVGSMSALEITVLILLSVIALMIFAANVVLIIAVIRKKKLLAALIEGSDEDLEYHEEAGDNI